MTVIPMPNVFGGTTEREGKTQSMMSMDENKENIQSSQGLTYDLEKILKHGWGFKLLGPKNPQTENGVQTQHSKSYPDRAINRAVLLNNALEDYLLRQEDAGRDPESISDGELVHKAIKGAAHEMADRDDIEEGRDNPSNNRKTLAQFLGNNIRLVDAEHTYADDMITVEECEARMEQEINRARMKAAIKAYNVGAQGGDLDELDDLF